MKQATTFGLLLALILIVSCKKENLETPAPQPRSSFTTRIVCVDAESLKAVSGLHFEYGRYGMGLPETGMTRQDGSFSLIEYFSNSFETTPHILRLPDFAAEGFAMFNPIIVLKNKSDAADDYLFGYYPVSQDESLREYRVPVYGRATVQINLKQGQAFISEKKYSSLFLKINTTYYNSSKTQKAESGEESLNAVYLRSNVVNDTLIHFPVLAGVDCEINWELLETYMPDVIPPGYDPGDFYLESTRISSGTIPAQKYLHGQIAQVQQNF